MFEGLVSRVLSPPSPHACGNPWLLKHAHMVIAAMPVVEGGLPFPSNLLSRGLHKVIETLISSPWSKAGPGLGATGGSQVSPWFEAATAGGRGLFSPRGDPQPRCSAERLPAQRTHTESLSESLQIPKHKK